MFRIQKPPKRDPASSHSNGRSCGTLLWSPPRASCQNYATKWNEWTLCKLSHLFLGLQPNIGLEDWQLTSQFILCACSLYSSIIPLCYALSLSVRKSRIIWFVLLNARCLPRIFKVYSASSILPRFPWILTSLVERGESLWTPCSSCVPSGQSYTQILLDDSYMELLLNIFIHHIGFRRLSKSITFAGANHSYQLLIADCPLFHWTSLAANGIFRDFQNILICTFWLHSDQGRTSNLELQRSPYLTTFQQYPVRMQFLTSQAPPALPLCMAIGEIRSLCL